MRPLLAGLFQTHRPISGQNGRQPRPNPRASSRAAAPPAPTCRSHLPPACRTRTPPHQDCSSPHLINISLSHLRISLSHICISLSDLRISLSHLLHTVTHLASGWPASQNRCIMGKDRSTRNRCIMGKYRSTHIHERSLGVNTETALEPTGTQAQRHRGPLYGTQQEPGKVPLRKQTKGIRVLL